MTDLKPGWKRVALGDVADVITDYWDRDPNRPERFVAGEHIDEGVLNVCRWGMTDDDLVPPTFNRRFKAGDVLFHSRNIRKLAQPGFGGITGEKIFVLRTRDPLVLMQELLPFLLQMKSFSDYTERMWAGSTNKFLNKAPLVRYEFALPPLVEQQQIIQLLDAVEENLERSRSLVLTTHAARLALRECLIERDCFKMAAIGELCQMQNGRPFSSADYGNAGAPLLRPANLAKDGTLDWRHERTVFVPESFLLSAREHVVNRGDVVINLTAQSLEDGFMGRACYVSSEMESLLNQRIGRFRGFREGLMPEYLFRVLQGARFQAHAIAMCEGTKVKHMFWRHIEVFRFGLPPEDQQQIACEQLRQMDAAYETALQKNVETWRLGTELMKRTLA